LRSVGSHEPLELQLVWLEKDGVPNHLADEQAQFSTPFGRFMSRKIGVDGLGKEGLGFLSKVSLGESSGGEKFHRKVPPGENIGGGRCRGGSILRDPSPYLDRVGKKRENL
jgi:hypothetical protein